jgi:hypothetical protein
MNPSPPAGSFLLLSSPPVVRKLVSVSPLSTVAPVRIVPTGLKVAELELDVEGVPEPESDDVTEPESVVSEVVVGFSGTLRVGGSV